MLGVSDKLNQLQTQIFRSRQRFVKMTKTTITLYFFSLSFRVKTKLHTVRGDRGHTEGQVEHRRQLREVENVERSTLPRCDLARGRLRFGYREVKRDLGLAQTQQSWGELDGPS